MVFRFDNRHRCSVAAEELSGFVERDQRETDSLVQREVVIAVLADAEEFILRINAGDGFAAYGATGLIKYRGIETGLQQADVFIISS